MASNVAMFGSNVDSHLQGEGVVGLGLADPPLEMSRRSHDVDRGVSMHSREPTTTQHDWATSLLIFNTLSFTHVLGHRRLETSMAHEFRLDELARQAGVASTTVRLYQNKGLLAAPRLEGRTGWYDESHLRRLRLIARLQAQGFSLAGIGALLEQWQLGRSIDAVIGVEAQLDALLGEPHAVVVDPVELLAQFPDGAMTPELMQRSGALSLVEITDDGKIRVPDRRFLTTGAALAHLGIPLDEILDEWESLRRQTDEIAGRFIALFERHLLADQWQSNLDSERAGELAGTLLELQATAKQALAAALDASVARIGRERLGALLPESEDSRVR